VNSAGKRVSDVAPKLAAAVEPFGVNLVEGVMSHQMKQFVIDGNKVWIGNAILYMLVPAAALLDPLLHIYSSIDEPPDEEVRHSR
jgi:hypothetical protein